MATETVQPILQVNGIGPNGTLWQCKGLRAEEKESRDGCLEEASSDRTAMRFVALTDHMLDHVGNTAAPSR